MQKIKWIFFGYLAFVALVTVAIAVAFNRSPARDPDTMYQAYADAIKTLDPAEVGDELGSDICSYMFESLYNYKYQVKPYEIFPELASEMPIVSADGLTMTIHIRHGIHYYDPAKTLWPDGKGPEVKAEDFAYSFKRVCDFHTEGGNYSFVFQDRVSGANDWWEYTRKLDPSKVDYNRPVEGFSVDPKDPYTLVMKFPTPDPQMIYNLVNCVCSPVCRELVEYWGDQIRKHPVGTGPYCMTENLREQRLTMVANPIYRGRPDIDGNTPISEAERMPKIKRIERDYFGEPLPAWLLFKEGLFDQNVIPKDAYGQAVTTTGALTPEMQKQGIVLQKYVLPTTDYIGFNMAMPMLGKNKPLRQAMSMAFNRAIFIDKFRNGRGMPAIGVIPPGFPTFDEHRINPYTQHNLEEAKKLMVEAVKLNGGPFPPLTILFRGTDTLSRQMAAYYADEMAQIGITLTPEYRDFARWQQMVDGRQFQLFDGAWQSDYPDEQDFLQLFYGPSIAPGGLNDIGYVNPVFDKLYEKAITLQDTPQRREIYLQLQKILEEDCPWLLVEYPKQFDLLYNWLGNRTYMDYGHGFMEHYTLDKTARASRLANPH